MDRSTLMTFLVESPSLALALLMGGMAGIYVELCRPGSVLPGSLGGVVALVALFALTRHELRWQGLLLVAASLACVALEVYFRARYVALGTGILIFAAGLRLLLPPEGPRIHRWTALALGAPFLAATFFLASIARQARLNKTL